MNKKSMLLVFAASLAMAGCAALSGLGVAPARQDCSAPVCNVRVVVNNCGISDPGELHVHGLGAHEIIWTLTASDHDFTATGISFPGGTQHVFSNPRHPQKGVFRWTDDYQKAGKYKYQIEAKKDGTNSSCPAIDPDVVNE